jgi:hypothetical protein
VISCSCGQRAGHHRRKRFLIGQLGCYGDCLYATTIARQIKTDYPDCHLTWAIGSAFRSILDNNPYVDEIWEFPLSGGNDLLCRWQQFEDEALELKKRGDFDEIVLTQLFPNNFKNFDGTVRSSIYRAYNGPITVPVAPVLRLWPSEIENVRVFAESHHILEKKHVILFECLPKSGQSFVTLEFALEVSRRLIERIPDTCIILSSNETFSAVNERIVDGSQLSFRENAELTKYCTLLVGCSSGISWLCTSDWAKPLPMIQLLKEDKNMYASFIVDHEYHDIPTDNIIEMTECSEIQLANCIEMASIKGVSAARQYFYKPSKICFDYYAQVIVFNLIKKMKVMDTFKSLKYTVRRFGFHPHIFIKIIMIYTRHECLRIYKQCMKRIE